MRGPFGYYGVQQMGTFGAVHGSTFGLFVQDSWQPTARLTMNAGIRADRQEIPSYNEYPGTEVRIRRQAGAAHRRRVGCGR